MASEMIIYFFLVGVGGGGGVGELPWQPIQFSHVHLYKTQMFGRTFLKISVKISVMR